MVLYLEALCNMNHGVLNRDIVYYIESLYTSPIHTFHRAAIFLRLANLLATKYRYDAIATTMIGQGKTVLQAEIDATCELIDFYRFAVEYALNIYKVSHAVERWEMCCVD